MKTEIKYNIAFDALAAIDKYTATYFPMAPKQSETDITHPKIDFTPSKQIKSWLTDVDLRISPFLKSDLQLVTRKVYGFWDTYSDILVEFDLETIDELLTTLRNMHSDVLTKRILSYYLIDVPYESDNKLIHEAITRDYGEEIANVYIQIKRFPDEYKDKVIHLIETFYKQFVQPNEAYVDNFISEKLKLHNARFSKNPLEFLNNIGLGDYSKITAEFPSMKIFISYYTDLGIYYGMFGPHFGLYYGFYSEERYSQQQDQDRYKNLFKALADERRLEIIRLTSARPWYNKELADYFGLTSATLSYHLNLLLDIGILNFVPSDNNRYYYTTNKEALQMIFNASLQSLIDQ